MAGGPAQAVNREARMLLEIAPESISNVSNVAFNRTFTWIAKATSPEQVEMYLPWLQKRVHQIYAYRRSYKVHYLVENTRAMGGFLELKPPIYSTWGVRPYPTQEHSRDPHFGGTSPPTNNVDYIHPSHDNTVSCLLPTIRNAALPLGCGRYPRLAPWACN